MLQPPPDANSDRVLCLVSLGIPWSERVRGPRLSASRNGCPRESHCADENGADWEDEGYRCQGAGYL